jgi:hypothetical protein
MRFTRAIVAALDPAAAVSLNRGPSTVAATAHSIASPWADPSHLNPVVWPDLGITEGPLSRAVAMTLPAVARQRHLIATAARLPFTFWQGETEPLEAPGWATRTDQPLPPFHRMLWTYDDLIFYGWSLWSTQRDPSTDELLGVERVAYERWGTDPAGRVEVDGAPVSSRDVILIPGPHEGILVYGAPSINMALSNSRAASRAARNPSAFTELHNTGEENLTDTQIDDLTSRWTAARNAENGGVAYTPQTIEVRNHGTHEGQLLVSGRNADAVDMSRLVGSPASMADATNAGASLTYETTTGRNAEFIDYGLALYIAAVDARLSQDDVCAPGQRVVTNTDPLRALDPAGTPVGPGRQD